MRDAPIYDLLRQAYAEASAPAGLPRHRVLYTALRTLILAHRLAPGTRLPSTRALADELRLSRNTVLSTFDALLAEGYLLTRTGSGTYVAATAIAAHRVRPDDRARAHRTESANSTRGTLSRRGERLARFEGGQRYEIQPLTGMDDFGLFPIRQWQRLHSRQMRRPELLDYAADGGWAPLRQAIADYIRVARAVRVEPEQVIVTGGTQHSLSLCAQMLADVGDTVWMEEPGYWGARCVFEAHGLQRVALPVDEDGADAARVQRGLSTGSATTRPRLIYVTPSNQYPLGVAMSLARRRALLDVAARERAWVLEDDYDSEFRFAGRPLASLQGMDSEGRVIYLGTFSKVLYPGIKVGYLVAPLPLVAAFRSAVYDLQRPGQLPTQAALAEFLAHGGFATHVRKLRQAYADRRERLLHTLAPVLALAADSVSSTMALHKIAAQSSARAQDARPTAYVRLLSQASGLHLTLGLTPGMNDQALAEALTAHGVQVRPLSAYYAEAASQPGLVAGYGYTRLADLEVCGRILSSALAANQHAAPAKALIDDPTSSLRI